MTPLGKLFIAAAFVSSASNASAQSPAPVTVTPYVAFGTEGAAPIGMMVTVPVGSGLSVESEVAYRRGEGDMNAMSSSLSVLKDLPTVGPITPYVSGGFGIAQYGTPVIGQAGSPTASAQRLSLTLNAGGGFKVPVRPSMDLRTDVRYFDGLGKSGDQFRIANGISFGASRSKTP